MKPTKPTGPIGPIGGRNARAALVAVLLLVAPLAAAMPAAAQTTFEAIGYGDTWSYLDDGSDQGTAWRAVDFDESSWPSGAGQLGYGDGDEATVVSYGPGRWNKYATTYFRHRVALVNTADVSAAAMSLYYDDGAVVYLNGVEVHRVHMPDVFDYATYTGLTREGTSVFTVDPGLLVDGTNVVAVEIHQSTRTSSDISFDLSFSLTTNGSDPIDSGPDPDPDDGDPGDGDPGDGDPGDGDPGDGDPGDGDPGDGDPGDGDPEDGDPEDEIPDPLPVLTDNIPYGSPWWYLDDGSDQATAWHQPGFSPVGWSSGPAQLGYGDGDEATVVSYGPDRWDKHPTTYFRRNVEVADLEQVMAITMSVLYDDGVVVYVNGTEVRRQSMPDTFDFATYAGRAREGTVTFEIDPSLLVEGTNVVAAEIHQAGPTSSDISFDLAMSVRRRQPLDALLPGDHPAIDIDAISVIPATGQHGVVGDNPGDSTYQAVQVWDMHQIGSHMYVGGEFQHVQLGAGGPLVDQRFLARFDVATGAYDPTFTPTLDGTVLDLALSPSGNLLVAGDFTSVNGVADTAALVAIDPATGEVDTSFRSSMRRPWSTGPAIVRDMKVEGDDLYAVGHFSHTYDRATGQRTRVHKAVRLDAVTGELDETWMPLVMGASVWGVTVDPVRNRVFLSGGFTSIAGIEGTARMAVVDGVDASVVAGGLANGGGWQTYDVEYVGDQIFAANNRENRVTVYNADGYEVTRDMPYSDGDFQFVERIGDVVVAGCHCWEDPEYPFVRALDASTGVPVDKVFDVSGNIEGMFTAASDTAGCLWIGGDIRNGGFSVGTVWARGFARFCP